MNKSLKNVVMVISTHLGLGSTSLVNYASPPYIQNKPNKKPMEVLKSEGNAFAHRGVPWRQ